VIWHPSTTELALVKTGDLPGWKAWLVERHLRRCDSCASHARSYADLAWDLRQLGESTPEEPPWLAERILAAAAGPEAHDAPATVNWLVPAAALALLALLAVLLVRTQAPLPRALDYQASATPQAVMGEMVGPQGRQRVVFYTGTRTGLVEVSAGAGAVGVSHADLKTGAVIITRISLGE